MADSRSVSWTDDLKLAVGRKTLGAPGPGQVQLRVGSAGICGSDLHFYRGDFAARPGVTPGHEFAGTVSAIGPDVKHVVEGDLVGVEPLLWCGTCRFCLTGDYHVCGERGSLGENEDGGMSEYVTVPAITAFKAPAGVERRACGVGRAARLLGARLREGQSQRSRDGVHRRCGNDRADRPRGRQSVGCAFDHPRAASASAGGGACVGGG